MRAQDPRGPRRLKDDPDFRWETGCDLSQEALLVGGYDLAGAKGKLLERIAAGAPPASPPSGGLPALAALQPLAGVLAVLGLVAGAYVAGLHAAPAPSAPALIVAPRPIELPVATHGPAAPVATEPGLATASSASPPVPVPRPRRLLPVVRVLPQTVAPAPAAKPPPATVTAPPPSEAPAAPASSPSSLQRQLAQYDRATEALERGDEAAARDGFLLYLATWPDGDLRPEAQIGLLQALHGTGDAAGAELLASQIQDLPVFAGRRAQILRLRAESLVLLDRCEEAVVVAEGLSSKDSADIRRACRSMRREGP